MYLASTLRAYSVDTRAVVRGPEDIARIVAAQESLPTDQERFYVVSLDSKNHVLAVDCVAMGTANMCLAVPRDIFRAAIKANAVTVALAHLHPTGDATPSGEDMQTTARLAQCGQLIGIPVVDHVVIGGHAAQPLEWYSIRALVGANWPNGGNKP